MEDSTIPKGKRKQRRRRAIASQAHNLRRIGSAQDEQRRLMESWAAEGKKEEHGQADQAA